MRMGTVTEVKLHESNQGPHWRPLYLCFDSGRAILPEDLPLAKGFGDIHVIGGKLTGFVSCEIGRMLIFDGLMVPFDAIKDIECHFAKGEGEGVPKNYESWVEFTTTKGKARSTFYADWFPAIYWLAYFGREDEDNHFAQIWRLRNFDWQGAGKVPFWPEKWKNIPDRIVLGHGRREGEGIVPFATLEEDRATELEVQANWRKHVLEKGGSA